MITANNDTANTPAATPAIVPVLTNDTLDGNPVAVGDLQGLPTITLPPSNGTATVNPNGTVTYTPNPGFCGTGTFEYEIETFECVDIYLRIEGGTGWLSDDPSIDGFDYGITPGFTLSKEGVATIEFVWDGDSGVYMAESGLDPSVFCTLSRIAFTVGGVVVGCVNVIGCGD